MGMSHRDSLAEVQSLQTLREQIVTKHAIDQHGYYGGTHRGSNIRRLAHLDEYQHSNPVPLALFLMLFFIVGVVVLRFTQSSAEPKKRSRKATAMRTEGRNSRSL